MPDDRRMWDLFRALDRGWSVEQIHELTKIDPWFLRQFAEIAEMRREAGGARARRARRRPRMRRLKRAGFGDAELALAVGADRSRRCASGGCAGAASRSTSASTPARRSSSRSRRTCTARTSRRCESNPTSRDKVVILGSGPNRIGQGIEFDYCCCHAAFALREKGFETVMINCNPETVSTDYDTADRLYFQPLTFEDVMAVIETERSAGGDVACLVQFGGQTPLKLALRAAGGRRPDSRHLARLDRPRRRSPALRGAAARARHHAAGERHRHVARGSARRSPRAIGFPVVVRPSYVLGGRAHGDRLRRRRRSIAT